MLLLNKNVPSAQILFTVYNRGLALLRFLANIAHLQNISFSTRSLQLQLREPVLLEKPGFPKHGDMFSQWDTCNMTLHKYSLHNFSHIAVIMTRFAIELNVLVTVLVLKYSLLRAKQLFGRQNNLFRPLGKVF